MAFWILSNLKTSLIGLTGDHCLVFLTIDETKIEAEKSIRRDWRNYTKDKLINEISKYDWNKSFETIQDMWNVMEK